MSTKKAATPMPQLGWGKIHWAVRLTPLSKLLYDWRKSNSIILILKEEKRVSFSLKFLSFIEGQSLATKFVVTLGYNFTQYLFIGGEFWQIHHWIISSYYILYACKISRKLKINNYIINKLFKLQVFVV